MTYFRFSNIHKLRQSHILIGLFLLALMVRIIGINYGYWFGDERINSAAKVLAGELVPGQHFYPPFLNYLTAVFFAALYALGRLFVAWHDLADFRAQYFTDPTPFYITARLVVACISATIAPLFYLIAQELGAKKHQAILVGLFGVMIPGMVLLSHISKGDVPLAVCIVLVFYVALKKIQQPASIKLDFLMGLSIALAFSFKQSYLFIFLPFYLGFLAIFYWHHRSLALSIRTAAIAGFVTLFFWAIFNIGILLDFQNFLDYQKIQSVMSIREEKALLPGLIAWWQIVADPFFGINTVFVILFFLFPLSLHLTKNQMVSSHRHLLLCFWIALVLGSLLLMLLSGSRQQSGLWVPYFVSMQLLAALSLYMVLEYFSGLLKLASRIIITGIFVFSLYGVAVVDKQAIAKPIVLSLETLIREKYDPINTRFLTSFTLRSPQTMSMNTEEYARHERIAARYKVVMPERAPEKIIHQQDPMAINYFNMPSAFFGLETAADDALEGNIKPYAWPIQKEEWQLDYWLAQGFRVFILGDHDYAREQSPVPVIRRFNQQIQDSCQLIQHFAPTKPLYIEFSATVYECQ